MKVFADDKPAHKGCFLYSAGCCMDSSAVKLSLIVFFSVKTMAQGIKKKRYIT